MAELVHLKEIDLTRHVRTEAGVRRYHKPIGTPLGGGHTPTKKMVKAVAHHPGKVKGVSMSPSRKATAQKLTVEEALKDPRRRKVLENMIHERNAAIEFVNKANNVGTPKFLQKLYSIAPTLKGKLDALRNHPATQKSKKSFKVAIDHLFDGVIHVAVSTTIASLAVQLGLSFIK